MRRARLSTVLAVGNVALLLAAILCVALVAVHLLGQLADDQALARVDQAGAAAQRLVSRSGDDLLTATQVLAERPTLKHLIVSGDSAGLAAYLEQYRGSGHLSACAVVAGDQVTAVGTSDLPWASLAAPLAAGDGQFVHALSGLPLVLGAQAAVPGLSGVRVIAVDLLDPTYSRSISAQIGLSVSILGASVPAGADDTALAALRSRVLASGRQVIIRLSDPPVYAAVYPIRSPSGNVLGVVQTVLPDTSTVASLDQLVRTLVLLAVLVAALATAFSLLLGRRLGRPLRDLTTAAAQIGEGDLVTPVPAAPGAEIGTLAATLDDMRGRLLHLTEDLRRQQAEAEGILGGIVEGVFSVDRERRIRYLNPQAAAQLGITPEAASGRFCGDVLNPHDRDGTRPCETRCPIVHARARGSTRATERLTLADGRQATVVLTSAPPANDLQVVVMRDETSVEAARRLRDAVLGNISHEFKTPLAAQLASIELLLDQAMDLPKNAILELVVALQRGTLRLTQLIDNLLESVRIEAGQMTIRRQRVALDEVVEEALALTRPLFAQREQEVTVELPYPLPVVTGDEPRLTQVFVNLLANANKFAPPRSTVRIGGAATNCEVALWVEDQGPGLSPAEGRALFERFVRAEGEEPEQGGIGLGLWIVQSIVERHEGRVEIEQGEGEGARIRVTLPAEVEVSDEGPSD